MQSLGRGRTALHGFADRYPGSGGLRFTYVRTNSEIDDDLLDDAMKVSGLATKRETVAAGLRLLVQLKRQQGIRSYRGKLRWEGNLERMRRDA